ncbi:MAG: hypothetical protein AABX75_00710 [Nanoarchaeota archaeon]
MGLPEIFDDYQRHWRDLVKATLEAVRAKPAKKDASAKLSEFEAKLAKVQADLAKLNAEVRK